MGHVFGREGLMDIEVRLDLRVEAVMGALALARPRLPDSGWLDHPVRCKIRRDWSDMTEQEAPRLIRGMLGRAFWVDDLCCLAAALLVERSGHLHSRFSLSPHSAPAASGCDRFARALQEFAERIGLHHVIEEAAEIPAEVTAAVGGIHAIAVWADYIRSTLGPGPSRIRILPSPLSNAHLGYGPTVLTDEGPEAWVIFGPIWRLDWKRWKLCGFNSPKFGHLVRHELGHSSLNRYTRATPEVSRFEYLFAPMQPGMRNLGYGRWDICLNELILRALEIRWTALEEGARMAGRLRERELRQGFTLIHGAERALDEISGVPLATALPDFLRALARSARGAAV